MVQSVSADKRLCRALQKQTGKHADQNAAELNTRLTLSTGPQSNPDPKHNSNSKLSLTVR